MHERTKVKKTIVVFIGGYLPAKKYGGPVTSIANLVSNLSEYYDFRIVSNDHDLDETKRLEGISDGWNKMGKAQVLYIPESEYKEKIFLSILKATDAHAIYLSSIFYYALNFPAIKSAKKLKIPVIMAPRGELCKNALSFGRTHKMLFLKGIQLMRIFDGVYFHATSEEEALGIQKYLKVSPDRISLMPNMHGEQLKRDNCSKNSGELKIVFLARIQEKKNLYGAIHAVLQARGKIQFDIYGPLEQEEYWEKCKTLIETAPDHICIKYKGALIPEEAKKVFLNYQCFLFPTFSENYGHVIAEALLCQCPVIISKGTTPWDDVNEVAGYTASLTSENQFVSCINRMVEMSEPQFRQLTESVCKYLQRKLMTDSLRKAYRDMFDNAIQK